MYLKFVYPSFILLFVYEAAEPSYKKIFQDATSIATNSEEEEE